MGFSGGGSNVLLPHTHDGTVSQDGGPLDFNNITQSQSAAGQVFFSDGAHLQQLSLGAASDELRVNAGATAPEWYTPAAAAGGSLEFIEEMTLGADTSSWLMTLTSAHVMADYDSLIAHIMIRNNSGSNPNITYRVNGIATNLYATNSMQTATGTVTGFTAVNQNSARVLTNWVGTGSAMINLEVFDNSARTGRDYTEFSVVADDNIYSNGALYTETDYASVSSMTIGISAGDILAAGARARFYRVKKT
jgi:hypothetical protein